MIRSSSNWRLSQSSSASTLSRGGEQFGEAANSNIFSLTSARSTLHSAYNKEDIILNMTHAGDLRFVFGSLASDDYIESECAFSLLQDIIDVSDWTAQLIIKADGLTYVRGLLFWSNSLPEERAKRLQAMHDKLSVVADFDDEFRKS